MVERYLAKVDVASSNLVSRLNKIPSMRDHGGDFGIVAGSCLSYMKVRSSRHSMELVGVVGRWGLGIGDRVGVGR